VNLRELEAKLEAILFASDEPLSVARLRSLLDGVEASEIREAVRRIGDHYRQTKRSFEVVEVAGGYQLVTCPEFADLIAKLYRGRRSARLSRAALETLAVIAYRQPVTRMEVEGVRGVDCDGVIHNLIDRELVKAAGRAKLPGNPILYRTTPQFLRYFGLTSLKELPAIDLVAPPGEHDAPE
jgi:segregation and condensation protein B